MPYTLTQAAKAVGRDRTTILRAVKTGKLSAARDQLTGAWLLEPAELHRLYPPDTAHTMHATGNAMARHEADLGEFRALQARLEAAEARLADKDAVIAEQRESLNDLRRRLDTEAEERRRLTMVLADLRARSEPVADSAVPPAPASRRWWPWRRARSGA